MKAHHKIACATLTLVALSIFGLCAHALTAEAGSSAPQHHVILTASEVTPQRNVLQRVANSVTPGQNFGQHREPSGWKQRRTAKNASCDSRQRNVWQRVANTMTVGQPFGQDRQPSALKSRRMARNHR